MILTFKETKLTKSLQETKKYLKDHGQPDNQYAKTERSYLKLLNKIDRFIKSKKVTNILIVKDKDIIAMSSLYGRLEHLGIKHEEVLTKGRTYVGGYVNKTVDCYIIEAIILKLRKQAPSYR